MICFKKLENENLRKRQKYYNLYQNELLKYLEINKIIDMQSNILLLKNIILNENQDEGLNYYESYFVPNDYSLKEQETKRLEDLSNMYQYYKLNVKKDFGKINKIDKKIFDNLNQELKAIFDE